ncbi:MAG: tRNA (guanosine(37)-N1)-methyltransferase TrmD [Holosporaceae bacterium]|jgi:tRNA (guanine37-N1)-methyltransferase|nr:tRNA (guanosine(37)-N1)-methyltransferase TrmD [Holosporaceae bacterium]
MWQANVFTIFPNAFPGNLGVSLVGKALELKKWRLNLVDLKKFPVKNSSTADRIDSAPCGGGVGMVLSPTVFEKAFNTLPENEKKWKKIYFSPRGRAITQSDLHDFSRQPGITMLCGRYEGVDQRIIDFYEMEEISAGDFVLLGGEVAAMMTIEGCVRLLPEVVGNSDSVGDDSFQNHLLEHNQYTKPATFNGLPVPDVLLSGNHQEIRKFRQRQSHEITQQRRPDLWAKYVELMMGII